MNIAVVTGAGRGLGKLVARRLADMGFAVLVTDLDEDSARATADEIGGASWSMQQDVRDPASHRRAARQAAEKGDLKVWVNNAGVLCAAAAWEHDDDEARLQIDVNLLGVIWGSRAAVEAMRSSDGGHIINMSSISSLLPVPGLAIYGASKAAVLGFSTSLAGDLERAHIPVRVSAVCPDAVETDMVREAQGREEAALLFSAHRLLSPERVARLVTDLIEHPKLVVVHPPSRAMLLHALHPFPSLELKVLKRIRKLGDRRRKRR